MDAVPVQNPAAAGESKSQRKKKAKAAEGTNGASNTTAVPQTVAKEDSSLDAKANDDASHENPHVKELQKQIRNTHKKLSGMQKVDAMIAENPKLSLDELVAQRKINADQKAAALKKPQLQQQLLALEEQISVYRKLDTDFQTQLQKQKDELTAQHQKELEKAKEELRLDGKKSGATELRKKLLVFSQFLRAAAAKRTVEEDAELDENRAFEGVLLLVYGGDGKAVETVEKLIEGADEQVPSIEGMALPVTYSQVKQASVDHAPYQMEESWVDSVAQANASANTTSDPTIAHAGLTELDTSGKTNGVPAENKLEQVNSTPQMASAGDDSGNAAGDRWDSVAAGGVKSGMEESFEIVPRPQDEVDVPVPAAPPAAPEQQKGMTSWADEPAYEAGGGNLTGNASSRSATEPPQPLSAEGWADAASGGAQEDSDGFHQVAGRNRGRGRGRGGDGEIRGRGRGRGGYRGDGELRGRGRGFRGNRGEGGGEFRGRGRGRGGPRGGADGASS